MGCPSCGAENPTTNKFCGECGAALVLVCGGCGIRNPPTNRFCGECGARLASSAGASAPAPATSPSSPQSYTPRHLAEKILTSRAGLEGERKQVTVLFADVVGSTELIRDRDPEEAQALLDGAVGRMMDAVHRYEGTVSRLMGDGLMAMFGAPVAHEDHAVRACRAALAMLEAAQVYADEVHRAGGPEIRIRVGLNSGEVVVRLIADDLHMDYTAMGRTVHLAARMEGLARESTAVLAPSTQALVAGLVDVRSLGLTPVRGLDEPIEVFELFGADSSRTRLQAAASRGLTRFVGRQAEIGVLGAALERARAGQGQVAALVGEPGVGKSRLVWEVTRGAAGNGPAAGPLDAAWTVLETGALSYGSSTAYLPIVSLLRTWGEVDRSDDPSTIAEKLTTRLQALDPGLESIRSPLLALLDVPVWDAKWQSLDPPRRRRETINAVKQVLLRQSRDRPLLLVFEDLHWLDAESQAVLDELVESLPTAPIFLVVTYRPEYRHEWSGKSAYTQIRVNALAPTSADELLESLLGADESLGPLKRHLIGHTDGNPFFLEESVRDLVETGALVGEPGSYRLTLNGPELRAPATVQAVLAARIDRLAPADKHLLQTAAVVGKDVPLALLQRVAGLAEEGLHGGLGRLRGAELMFEVLPEAGYTFKHALTHEVAYSGLLQSRRRSLHGQIVAAIEALGPDRLDEHVERLADHVMRGELWEKALDYCRRAGRRDLERSALREAGAWFEQALVALRHLPESRGALEQRIDVAIELRNAINPLGDIYRAYDFLCEAERLAEQIGDQARLGRVHISMNSYLYLTGKPRQALEMNSRALQIARDLDDAALEVAVWGVLGSSYLWLGDFDQASAAHRAALEMVGDQTERGRVLLGSSQLLAVAAHGQLAWCLGELGMFPEAIEHGETAVRMAGQAGHTFSQIGTSHQFGLAWIRRGDLDQAIELLEDGLEMARASGFRAMNYFGVASRLGEAYVTAGRIDDAVPLLEDVVNRGRALGAISDYLLAMGPLAEAYAALGQYDGVLALARDAVHLAGTHGFRGLEAHALRYLGTLHARAELFDAEIAERRTRQALVLAEELRMRPLQAHCHLGLGKLYRRPGRLDEARAELATAVGMLREMGMAFWLPEAERELAAARR